MVEEIANRGEIAASGQPLLKLQGSGALEVELILPSTWLAWLKPGAPFDFTIDETGRKVSGTVKRLGPSADPVSKTARARGDSVAADATVLPGMSGTATFDPDQAAPAQPAQPAPAGTDGDGVQKRG